MLINPDSPVDNLTVFKKFWNDIDRCYPFFDIKTQVDWDSVYKLGCTYFSPEREALQDEKSIHSFYDSIIKKFYDPHITFTFRDFHWPNDEAHSWTKYQEADPLNMYEYIYEQNVSIFDGTYFNDFTSFWDDRIWFAPVSDSICYFNIFDFHDQNFKKEKFDPLINKISKYKVCIIDLRVCIGGSSGAAEELCSRLNSNDFVYGYEQCKDGYEHDSFKKPLILKITASKGKKYTGDVILLINRKTVSAGEWFALAMKECGRAQLFGDTTMGHFGEIVFRELNNGWFYTFSGSKVLDKNLKCKEDVGIIPDSFFNSYYPENDRDFLLDNVLDFVNGVRK
jgi:hypothetical protein